MDNTTFQSPPVPHGRPGSRDEGEAELENKKPGSKAYGHKRTKTGCLTCRKRRIKCGEEKPTCQNCIKSKRQCEGYNQRVVFKEPMNVYRGPQTSSSQASSSRNTFNARQVESSQRPLPALGPLPIAPKPSGSTGVTSNAATSSTTTAPSIAEQGMYEFRVEESFTVNPVEPLPRVTSKAVNDGDTSGRTSLPTPRSEHSPQDIALHSDLSTFETADRSSRSPLDMAPASTDRLGWPDGPTTTTTAFQFYPSPTNWHLAPESSASLSTPFAAQGAYNSRISAQRSVPTTVPPSQESYQHIQSWDREQQPRYHDPSPEMPESLEPVSVPWRTDIVDPYDVSDDDTDMDDETVYQQDLPGDSCTTDNELGVIVALQAGQANQDLSLRSITSFIDRPNMLATYVPSHRSSPLNDSMTARIFAHFINVTAPTMSMFERHPSNPSLIFSGTHVPKSQQNVWSYSLASLAFRNEGLLHAMLAMASLHIAKLQNDHITASLKHYSISLRRIVNIVSNPVRRTQPATLAASLLLAFYECWGADHQKWSNHLLGAKMIIKEIDFAGMTKYLKSIKLKRRQEEESQHFPGMHQTFGGVDGDSNLYQRLNEDVDQNIVGMLMGKRVRYDQYGHIIDDDADNMGRRSYTQQQLEDYEIQRDLFWWYLKMDSYHSILGGGRLFMEYDRWSHCPPRAPLGRLNATCGTYDHLILLLGRVGDFAAKDLKRKRLAWKANTERRPPPTQSMSNQAGQHGPPQAPPFAGMVPETGEARLPRGFERSFGNQAPKTAQADYTDLEAQRIEAEEEWNDIMNAFSILEDHFGEDFQALGPEFSQPIQSPFGTALQYRTYAIAGIWMNYYMALIVCHRAHPSMPPAAMMAAGMAARHTASFANEVGRIAAGVGPNCESATEVTPNVGAALIEVSFCLFISGVQYQDQAHRAWTVNRLRAVTRLTGWASSTAAISGCESSWQRQAEVGGGPPYTRTTERRIAPPTSNEERRQMRRIDVAMEGMNSRGGKFKLQETDRAHYAMGLLGVEEDFEKLVLESEEGGK